MRDSVLAEAGEVAGYQELRVADLNGVAPAGRKRGQERIEVADELAGVLVAAFSEGPEFEDDQRAIKGKPSVDAEVSS